MGHLPMELITEILLRLPVKSLVRFCCVSKPWESSITSQDFIKLHLKKSTQNKTNQAVIIRDCYIFSLDFPTLNQVSPIEHPLKTPKFGTEVLGSCDGLLCLSNGEEEGMDGTIFYNPATRKRHELPASPIEYPENSWGCERLIYGFGYDHINDDYKLVRVTQFAVIKGFRRYDRFDSEVKVYSLKLASWRRIGDFPRDYYLSYKKTSGIYVSGCLHWVVTRNPDSDGTKFIISFDLGSEEYKVLPQPQYSSDDEFHMNVDVLGECLCVSSNYVGVKFDVWVMKEYGVKESWSKLFTITQGGVMGLFEYVKPLAYSNDGSSVLLIRERGMGVVGSQDLIWFNWEAQTVEIVKVTGPSRLQDLNMMVESLVPLKCHQKNKEEKVEKKKNQPKRKAKKSNNKRGGMDGFLAKGFNLKL